MSNPTIEQVIASVPKTEQVFEVGSLMCHLGQLTDPRDVRGVLYSLVTLLTQGNRSKMKYSEML